MQVKEQILLTEASWNVDWKGTIGTGSWSMSRISGDTNGGEGAL